MHEDVFAGLRGDEAIALVGVEPFYGSNSNVLIPSLRVLEVSTQRQTLSGADGKGQARPAGCEAKREPLPGAQKRLQPLPATTGRPTHAAQDNGCACQLPERGRLR